MGLNKSPLALEDAREILERALGASKGIRVRCPTHGAAIRLRARLNTCRVNDRATNMNIYEPGHYMYGSSAYDRLVVSIPKRGTPEECYVYIKPRSAEDAGEIEELTGEDESGT